MHSLILALADFCGRHHTNAGCQGRIPVDSDLQRFAVFVLVSLLVLPLYIPILIFGAGAVEASAAGLGAAAHLSLLGAFLLASMVLAPWTTAVSLRISME